MWALEYLHLDRYRPFLRKKVTRKTNTKFLSWVGEQLEPPSPIKYIARLQITNNRNTKVSLKIHLNPRCLNEYSLQGRILQNEIAIIEPSSNHYYQPMWTMVGAGMYKTKDSRGSTKEYLPSNSKWIQDSVQSFQPDENSVTLKSGRKVRYETLIVAAGLQIDWHKIPGLVDALEDESCPVASIYHHRYAEKVNTVLSGLQSGQAIFTVPVGGIKCGGAPQKIMWSWESNWTASGVRPNISILFT